MPLTNTEIKAARPATDKNGRRVSRKLADGGGLYLLITPTGSKLWRWKFRFAGKEKKLSFGAYPKVGVAEARARRDEEKKRLSANVDPALHKQLEKQNRKIRAANTFEKVAEEYIGKREKEGTAAPTVNKAK
ncbi:MAG TPA: integrase arm-type DNA-binding domain-containing protein, partial [Rhizomicrobium sp.]|nr:integrase arm-type DNA-binding domain-containing protein [Rhizomicrobium sp.]